MEAPGHVHSVPSPKSGTGAQSSLSWSSFHHSNTVRVALGSKGT